METDVIRSRNGREVFARVLHNRVHSAVISIERFFGSALRDGARITSVFRAPHPILSSEGKGGKGEVILDSFLITLAFGIFQYDYHDLQFPTKARPPRVLLAGESG